MEEETPSHEEWLEDWGRSSCMTSIPYSFSSSSVFMYDFHSFFFFFFFSLPCYMWWCHFIVVRLMTRSSHWRETSGHQLLFFLFGYSHAPLFSRSIHFAIYFSLLHPRSGVPLTEHPSTTASLSVCFLFQYDGSCCCSFFYSSSGQSFLVIPPAWPKHIGYSSSASPNQQLPYKKGNRLGLL